MLAKGAKLEPEQRLRAHIYGCVTCKKAKNFTEMCQSGRILSRIVESETERKKIDG